MIRSGAALAVLMLLGGTCSRPASQASPDTGATMTIAVTDPPSTDASRAEAPIDTRAPVIDPRPRALARLVPVDGDDGGVAGPTGVVPGCDDKLAEAGVVSRPARLPVHTEGGSREACGAPQVVTYVRGPGAISYDPPPLLTCAMALALSAFEPILQDEAARLLHSRIARIQQLGTYNCRQIVAVKGLASEHSYANAIDLARFTLESGAAVTVLRDFDMGEGAPAHPAGAFLRAVSERAQDEDVFSNVLTPFWDPAHKDHFHLDLARYRVDGVHARAR